MERPGPLWGHLYSQAPLPLVAHKPGLTCRSVLRGTICYLHLSSINPASILRKEKLLLSSANDPTLVCQPPPGTDCSPPGAESRWCSVRSVIHREEIHPQHQSTFCLTEFQTWSSQYPRRQLIGFQLLTESKVSAKFSVT